MTDPTKLTIVILGASFSGISVVHHLIKHAFPQLTESEKFSYRIVLVSPSTHLYWNICAPRALVSKNLIPHEDSFQPIAKGVRQYGADIFEYIHGSAVALDTVGCNVTIIRPSTEGEDQAQSSQPATLADTTGDNPTAWGDYQETESQTFQLHYHALVIATGSTAHSPLLSLRGPHTNAIATLDTFHKKLPTADTIVIAGGGPSGVETAGQIAYFYNKPEGPNMIARKAIGAPSLLSRLILSRSSKLGPHKKQIILLSGNERLLPNIDHRLGAKALKQLTSLGVRVILETRVKGASVASSTGKTTLRLSNDSTMTCDLYVPCTGVSPNTQFLPRDSPLLRNGYIATTPSPTTMRVDVPPDLMPAQGNENVYLKPEKAGNDGIAPSARVYAIGDCAAYSDNCILDIYAAIPVLINNLTNDLLAAQLHFENPYGGNEEQIAELQTQDMEYIKDERDSQVVPIGYRKPGGVGAIVGHRLPSLVVYLAKGRKYKIDAAPKTITKGLSPY